MRFLLTTRFIGGPARTRAVPGANLKPLSWLSLLLVALVSWLCALAGGAPANSKLRFEVSFPASASSRPLDGRILLIISKDPHQEPRFTISSDSAYSQQLFGVDVNGLAPGENAIVDTSVLGYPLDSLKDVPPGDYNVQAVLNVYETFHRADGFTLKLPMDHGEG